MSEFDDLERAMAGFLECQDRPHAEAEILAAYADVRRLIEQMLGHHTQERSVGPATRGIPVTLEVDIPLTASIDASAAKETTESIATPPSSGSIRHYDLVREIGRGGMGVVYEGYDTQLRRRVAIKSIKWDNDLDQLRIERFRSEAQLLASIQHPNIGAIYSFEHTDDGNFLILEYIEGETIAALVRKGPVAIETAQAVARQMAEALAAAHEQGVAHRDLSPANVMVRPDGKVKVLDFGLARSIGEEQPTDQTRSPVMGTPSYMSPETLRGGRSRASADVRAFGCLLFEMLSGQRAFEAPAMVLLMSKIIHDPPPFDRLPAETPEAVVDLLRSCFEKDPAVRLLDLRQAIEILATGLSGGLSRTTQWTASVQPLQRVGRAGEALVLRAFVENTGRTLVSFDAELASGSSWTGAPVEPFSLEAGEVRELLIPIETEESGKLRLPELILTTGTERQPLAPRPSSVSVEGRGAGKPCLQRREWDLVESALARSDRETGELMLVEGPAASGRSMTLDHLDRSSRRLGFRTLRANPRSGMGQRFKLAHDLLRNLISLVESEHRDESLEQVARSRLQEFLGRGSPNVEYFLARLLGRETEPEDNLTTIYRWHCLLSSVTRHHPCLLLIDDLDHADSASLEWLRSIMERCHDEGVPIVAIGTVLDLASHAEPNPELEQLTSPGPRWRHVSLSPLQTTEIDRLIERYYPGTNHRDYASNLADTIRQRTGGHLGTTAELVEALSRENGELPSFFRQSGSKWVVSPEVQPEALLAALPLRYADLMARRLDSLSEEGRAVLETAGLLGTEIPVDVLEKLILEEKILDDGLDALESAEILVPVDPELTRYRFSSPLFTTLAIQKLEAQGSRKARRRKAEVSKCLQEYFSDSRFAEELGLRLLDLGDSEAALPYLMQALTRHVRLKQAADADALAVRMSEIVDRYRGEDPRFQYDWRVLEGRVHTLTGRLDRAESVIERAMTLAEQLDDAGARAACLVQLSELAFRRGQFERVSRLADEAQQLASAPGLERVRADAVQNLATALRRLGRPVEARDLWEANRNRYVQWSDRSGEARATNNLGILHYEEDRLLDAEACFRKTEEIGLEIDNLDFVTTARNWLSNVAFKREDLVAARRGYQDAVEIFRTLHNRRALSRCYHNLAEVESLLGNFSEARPAADRAANLCAEMGDQATEAEYRLSRASIEWLEDRHAAALAEVEQARSVSFAITAPTRLRAFQARAALLEDRLGNSSSVCALDPAKDDSPPNQEVALLEATVIARSMAIARDLPDRDQVDSWVQLLRGSGLDTLTEAVELAMTILPYASHLGESIESVLGKDPEETPAAAWIRRAAPRLSDVQAQTRT